MFRNSACTACWFSQLSLLADNRLAVRESDCQILLAGDVNCHLLRNTRFENTVKNFLEDSSLIIFWENTRENQNVENVDYTHVNTANKIPAFSSIDHFAGSWRVFQSVTEAGVVHSGDNSSNHSHHHHHHFICKTNKLHKEYTRYYVK